MAATSGAAPGMVALVAAVRSWRGGGGGLVARPGAVARPGVVFPRCRPA